MTGGRARWPIASWASVARPRSHKRSQVQLPPPPPPPHHLLLPTPPELNPTAEPPPLLGRATAQSMGLVQLPAAPPAGGGRMACRLELDEGELQTALGLLQGALAAMTSSSSAANGPVPAPQPAHHHLAPASPPVAAAPAVAPPPRGCVRVQQPRPWNYAACCADEGATGTTKAPPTHIPALAAAACAGRPQRPPPSPRRPPRSSHRA